MSVDGERQFQRLLALASRLMGSNGLTVKELGGSTRSLARRIQRDLIKLRECGIPLDAVGEREPRYRLDNLRMAGPKLNLEETLAITLALHQAGQSGLGSLARQGWDKLHYAVVNGRERRSKTDLPPMLSVKTTTRLPVGFMEALTTGLLDCRRIRLLYQGLSDTIERWRLVEPRQLFFQDQWYLSCWDPAANSLRTFRADRIKECELTGETFQRASVNESDTHFHRWDISDDEPVDVHCRVDAAVARWLQENPVHPSQRLEGIDFHLKVRDVDAFLRWVSSLSFCLILKPRSLRDAHRERLRRLLQVAEKNEGHQDGS